MNVNVNLAIGLQNASVNLGIRLQIAPMDGSVNRGVS